MISNVGIIGYGEVGSALESVYKDFNVSPKIYDLSKSKSDDLSNVDLLNICIPYSEDFVPLINSYITKYSARMTVIHSTVKPGTTGKIQGKVAHSPIRGVHPNLKKGITTFMKYIGSEDNSCAEEYSRHLRDMGINNYICKNSVTTEIAKLLDTFYYGVCIAVHSEALEISKKSNVDFDEIMTIYNTSYNEGYMALGKQNVIRPVLYGTDRIGGHCIVPNAKLLNEFFESPLIDAILKFA
jgi:3-hydroxyisobutyrate dehydrogenase-like beta-hydroxyacid dehydrogenase